MIEIWNDVEGFENKYQVSNTGKIKSLSYNNTNKEKIMSPRLNKKGVYTINLWKNNKAHQFSVALLVARAFLKKENEDDVVVHIGDKLNDSVDNLMYVSRKQSRNKYEIIDTKNDKKYNLNRKAYKKITEKAKDNGISNHRLHERIERGWTLEEAITIPTERTHKILHTALYDFYGKPMSIKQLSKKYNISTKNIYKRLLRGWNIYEAVELPLSKTNERRDVNAKY